MKMNYWPRILPTVWCICPRTYAPWRCPAPAEGLSETDVAKITDAVLANTDYTAAQINVIEVMNY